MLSIAANGSRAQVLVVACICLLSPLQALGVEPLRAAPSPTTEASRVRDRYDISAISESHALLFRRALLPGPNGSLVSTDTATPIYEYVRLGVRDLDTPLKKDSLDLELAAWARGWLGERKGEGLLDGDVQTANARLRLQAISVRLGRQQVFGGAARFARFDGVLVETRLFEQLELAAYAGWHVLPRWNERRRYEHLGAASDNLQRDTPALMAAQRGQYWLIGGRIAWGQAGRQLGLSVHEQREPLGLAQRNVGGDLRWPFSSRAVVGATAVFALDRRRFADARLWLDVSPLEELDVTLDFLHTEPGLLLSQQSIFAAFGPSEYDEGGLSARLRLSEDLALDGALFGQRYADTRVGGRGELALRVRVGSSGRTSVRLVYARVSTGGNGYHSIRTSLSRTISQRWLATAEAYGYFYDRPIRGYRSSSVYAATLSYEPVAQLRLLCGASLSRSPYAELDAQAQLRISYAVGVSSGGPR